MELDPKIAESIVTNLKDVIQHEINLFDATGTIIASTDRTRIGTSHDGARLAISTKKPVVIDNDHEFKGARHGINAPVLFNGSVVAVIGITGPAEEVAPFGTVIEKMTEILLRENQKGITRFDQRERFSNLVTLLTLREHDDDLVAYLASMLEIDFSLPRRAVVVQPAHGGWPERGKADIYPALTSRLADDGTAFFSVTDQRVIIYTTQSYARMHPFLEGIKASIAHQVDCPLLVGIGDLVDSQDSYWRSYQQALQAIAWTAYLSSRDGSQDTSQFSNMGIGIVISSVPRDAAEEYVSHVFADLPDEKIQEYAELFYAYAKHNGSIKHCSEDLFMHKNTLQNRLNKIAEDTGYNPRDLKDFSTLDAAFSLWGYLRSQKQCGDES